MQHNTFRLAQVAHISCSWNLPPTHVCWDRAEGLRHAGKRVSLPATLRDRLGLVSSFEAMTHSKTGTSSCQNKFPDLDVGIIGNRLGSLPIELRWWGSGRPAKIDGFTLLDEWLGGSGAGWTLSPVPALRLGPSLSFWNLLFCFWNTACYP